MLHPAGRALAVLVVLALAAHPAHAADPTHTDASAAQQPATGADPLESLTWSLGVGLFADHAPQPARDLADVDLVYLLAAEAPELLTEWVGLGWRALLMHDLDGDVDEPLALTDTGTGREHRIHARLEALWLRVGPRDVLSVTAGRHAVPGPGIADVRPVVDGATATLRLDEWLELSALGGVWTDVWELGGCPDCPLAWGTAARVGWLTDADDSGLWRTGELSARALGYGPEVTGNVRIEQRLARWRARSQVGLYGASVYHADLSVDWGPPLSAPPLSAARTSPPGRGGVEQTRRSIQPSPHQGARESSLDDDRADRPERSEAEGAGAGVEADRFEIGARWRDTTGVPTALLGGSRVPEAIAEAVRSRLPERLFDAAASLSVRTVGALRVDAGVGVRVVDARRRTDLATERWPWRDALRLLVGISRGHRVEVGATATLVAALGDDVAFEGDDSPVAGALEAWITGRPADGVEVQLRAHTGLHDQGAAGATIAQRGDHGGALGAQWCVPVWGATQLWLGGQWQVMGSGRAPFDAVPWMQGLEVWMRLEGL